MHHKHQFFAQAIQEISEKFRLFYQSNPSLSEMHANGHKPSVDDVQDKLINISNLLKQKTQVKITGRLVDFVSSFKIISTS